MTKRKLLRLAPLMLSAQACGVLVDNESLEAGLHEVRANLRASMGTPNNARMSFVWMQRYDSCEEGTVRVQVATDLGSAVVAPSPSVLSFLLDEPPPAGFVPPGGGALYGGLIGRGRFMVYADNNGNGELDLRTIENPDTPDLILGTCDPYEVTYVEGEIYDWFSNRLLPQGFSVALDNEYFTVEYISVDIDVPEEPDPRWQEDSFLCGEKQVLHNHHSGIWLDLELRDDGRVYLPDGTDYGEFVAISNIMHYYYRSRDEEPRFADCVDGAIVGSGDVETSGGPCTRVHHTGTVRVTTACEADCAGITWPCP